MPGLKSESDHILFFNLRLLQVFSYTQQKYFHSDFPLLIWK